MKEFTLTKQIAKHGDQAVLVIPKMLQDVLKPKTMVEVRIRILDMGVKDDARE